MVSSFSPPSALVPEPVPESYRAGTLMSLVRLRWFINLRWIIMLTGLVGLALEHLITPAVRRPIGLVLTIFLIGIVNLGWMVLSLLLARRARRFQTSEAEAIHSARLFANAQMATDLLLLTVILRYTGGGESPMTIFYVFHMAIGSLLLKTWQALLHGL